MILGCYCCGWSCPWKPKSFGDFDLRRRSFVWPRIDFAGVVWVRNPIPYPNCGSLVLRTCCSSPESCLRSWPSFGFFGRHCDRSPWNVHYKPQYSIRQPPWIAEAHGTTSYPGCRGLRGYFGYRLRRPLRPRSWRWGRPFPWAWLAFFRVRPLCEFDLESWVRPFRGAASSCCASDLSRLEAWIGRVRESFSFWWYPPFGRSNNQKA